MKSRTIVLVWSLGLSFCIAEGVANAQCSRGGGSRGSMPSAATSSTPTFSGSNGGLTFQQMPALVASQQRYANDRALAMRRQMVQYQQQLLAMRQRANFQRLQIESDQQQELLAMRRQRADDKRARRAERIAANAARLNSERAGAAPTSRDIRLVAFTQAARVDQ